MANHSKPQPPFSLLIKPGGADCNLVCAYCFYLGKSSLYPKTKTHRMSDAVLERIVSSYMATKQPVYAFGWQGGEPTLMGLDFFRKVVRLQQRYAPAGAVITNGLQTNGTLLTDALAAFFTEYRFLLGVSLDGPAEIHDHFRQTLDGVGSHRNVIRGIRALRRQKTEFNVLTLVTKANVGRGKEVYRYLKEEGVFFHQYIPCVEYDETGTPLPWSIGGGEWGRFLLDIFEAWYPSDARSLSIRHFDSVIEKLITGRANACAMDSTCKHYFLVEHNGDVYPCDFFVEPGWKLGNLMERPDWSRYQNSSLYESFAARKGTYGAACVSCPFVEFCHGDCPKHRIPFLAATHPPASVLCEGWRLFYRRTLPEFRKLADQIMRRNITASLKES